MLKTKVSILMLITILSSPYSVANEEVSETELCASVASQYRFFDDAYRQGANWNPYQSEDLPRSQDAQSGIYNALLIASFLNKSNLTKQAIDQQLIKLAYDNVSLGISATFGQYYVFFNCMNIIEKDPREYYTCDSFTSESITDDGMERFHNCATGR